MATEAPPVNGAFHAPHHHHHHPSQYHAEPFHHSHAATNFSVAPYNPAHHVTAGIPTQANEPKNDISKDEVGWYFVEQYYTTLSRNPEKLHLFYSRKSQFVSGAEAEKVTVAVGHKAIQERIKELDFQECKVRVLNVDSQASFENILVCVIGEISNKSEPPRRFVQTFVLAQQPNGYYVLNDIIRYLVEEDEELVPEEAGTGAPAAEGGPVVAPVAAATTTELEAAAPHVEDEPQADTEVAAHHVDEKLEEAATNGDLKPSAEEPAPAVEDKAETPTPVAAEQVPVSQAYTEALEPEKPKEPEPTPVAPSPSKSDARVAAKSGAPAPARAAPMSWASVASRPGQPAPAAASPVAVPASSTTSSTTQQKTAPASQDEQPHAPVQPPTAAEVEKAPSQSSSSNGEWQTADHTKRQSRTQQPQQQETQPTSEENTLAFVKNVNEKVDAALLKQTLSHFGKLRYFNVNRAQGCAFVEFQDAAGYKAAVAANPHQIGSERINVEERRPRGNAYGNAGYGPGRGGSGRGRGDRASTQGRSGGFQKDSGRYPARGRGGNITPKGNRSQAQAS